MIILITLGVVCFFPYAVWVIDVMSNQFNSTPLGILASLFAILMPPAIIVQMLAYFGVITIK